MGTYELYRKSSIGSSLTDSLDELVISRTISPILAVKVLMQFDQSMRDVFSTNLVKVKSRIKGHLHTYRFCDHVWTFILENASFEIKSRVISVDRVKIVACDAKLFYRWKTSSEEL
ncbi:hypothetical protein M758_7G146400 [Ceratodon purpureus]|nr:hypothetical protein M758_7G146400 [Ceratodon purpureus]